MWVIPVAIILVFARILSYERIKEESSCKDALNWDPFLISEHHFTSLN